MAMKTPTIDVKQFTIKPCDIGYDTESATELSPTTRQAFRKASPQNAGSNVNTRPPIMLYPGV